MKPDNKIIDSIACEAKLFLDQEEYTYSLNPQENEKHLSYLLNNYQQKKIEIDKAKKDLMNFYHFNKAVNNYLDYLDECDTDCELFIYNKWR